MSTPPTSARTAIETWLAAYTEDPNPDQVGASYEGAPLRVSDLRSLVDAFDQPCGSCHPCVNYADQMWRDADRHPPTPRDWDETRGQVKALRELVAYCRTEADDRDNVDGERSAYDDTATKLAEILRLR